MKEVTNHFTKRKLITPKDIEENIGFSKDFNVFELRKAIGERNQLKAYTIAENNNERTHGGYH
jgi:DNA polymerase III delta subunit